MTFEKLNKGTKKAREAVNLFYLHRFNTLFDIYGRPSYEKIRIFEELKKELEEEGFGCVSAISGGTSYFSMAGENATHIAYITKSHNYLIEK